MKNANTKNTDKAAEKTLADYCARYAVNRPFGSSEIPSLIVATMSGTGREVYNRDGGSVIASFSSTEVARKAVHKLTGVWTNY
jgi:hypothetical protein